LGVVAALDPGKEGFDSIQKRLRKLEKEADGYKDTDQADLAEGLKDDIQETKERLEKARKDSKARVLRTIAMGAAAAAAIGAAVFAFGPRRAYAASITKDAARDVPTLSAGPGVEEGSDAMSTVPLPSEFQAADKFSGAKPGFVFTTGAHGTGYYADKGPFSHAPPAPEVSDKTLADRIKENRHIVAAVGVAGVVVPFGVSRVISGKKSQDPGFSSDSPFFNAPMPKASPPKPSASAPAGAADPFSPPASAPAAAAGGKDPVTMRASELKKAIGEMGGSTVGLVEKSELVELYTRLQSEASVRKVEAEPFDAAAYEAGMGEAPDMSNMRPEDLDPGMVDEMMKNPMMRSLQNQMMSDPQAMQELQSAMSGGKGMGDILKSEKFQQMAKQMMNDPEVSQMMKDPAKMKDMMDQMKKMGVPPPPGM